MKELFEKLFCKHSYSKYDERMIDFGMGKMIYLKCTKCDKRKVKII